MLLEVYIVIVQSAYVINRSLIRIITICLGGEYNIIFNDRTAPSSKSRTSSTSFASSGGQEFIVAMLVPALIFDLVHAVRVAQVASIGEWAEPLVSFKGALMAQV